MQAAARRLRFPLAVDHRLGRIAQEENPDRYVESLIRQLIFTDPGERVHRGPEFGCGLRKIVFSPNSFVAATLAEITVREALERWLGDYLVVRGVRVTPRDETLWIELEYVTLAQGKRRFLNLEIGP